MALSPGDSLSVIAIIIAVVAFFISLAQLLQQYFATADGYRRCLDSVIGPWSCFTRRRFRWSEFRFETRFTTPYFQLGAVLGTDQYGVRRGQMPLAGAICTIAPGLLERKNAKNSEGSTRPGSNEWVCWISLLDEIMELQRVTLQFFAGLQESAEHWPGTISEEVAEDDESKDEDEDTVAVFDKIVRLSHQELEKKFWPTRPADLPWHRYRHSWRIRRRLRLVDVEGNTPWKKFIDPLRDGEVGALTRRKSPNTILDLTIPTFDLRRQSWDFMPTDVLKPPASVGISDLAIIVMHLGMRWLDFRPADSILRAEGNGLLLTSSYIRALGCLIEVRRHSNQKGRAKFPMRRLLIPSEAANSMVFGMIPTSPGKGFNKQFIKVGTFAEKVRVMDRWDVSGEATEILRSHKSSPWFSGFLDIIPLVVPMLRHRGSPITRIPAPFANAWGNLNSATCRLVFPLELEPLIKQIEARPGLQSGPKRTEVLRQILAYWTSEPGVLTPTKAERQKLWTNPDHDARGRNAVDIGFLEEMHDRWQITEDYFSGQSTGHGRPPFDPTAYKALVQIHIKHAILAVRDAEEAEKDRSDKKKVARYPEDLRKSCANWRPRNAQNIYRYFKRLEAMWLEASKLDYWVSSKADDIDFYEAWGMLMLRGFCWNHCHRMIEDLNVPSEYWNSRMPIYIG